jgi:hypothetical protein
MTLSSSSNTRTAISGGRSAQFVTQNLGIGNLVCRIEERPFAAINGIFGFVDPAECVFGGEGDVSGREFHPRDFGRGVVDAERVGFELGANGLQNEDGHDGNAVARHRMSTSTSLTFTKAGKVSFAPPLVSINEYCSSGLHTTPRVTSEAVNT